jgi:DNA repair protein RadA/Sms
MLLAILAQHAGVTTDKSEVYASVAGGLRVSETGADLALALAVGSAQRQRPVVDRTVAVGELGLGGEVRTVPQLERRLDEAARLGFTRALVPASVASRAGLEVVPVRDVTDALGRGLG